MPAQNLGASRNEAPNRQPGAPDGCQTLRQKNRQPTPTDALVGANLKRLRRSRKVSQIDLGDAIGMSFKQIRKYEAGENRISASVLFFLAIALDVDVEDFYEGLPLVSEYRKLPEETESDALREMYQMIDKAHERSAFLRLVKQISENKLYT